MKHRMKDGTEMDLKDMSAKHLRNTINLLRQKAHEGLTISKGGGTCAEDMWYDEYEVFDAAAWELMKGPKYEAELKRRLTQYG